MKTTGIVRKLDELGRITLPIELRRTLGVSDKDALEISVEDDKIILSKYEPACIFTGEKENLIEFHGKKISKNSIIETLWKEMCFSLHEVLKTLTGEE